MVSGCAWQAFSWLVETTFVFLPIWSLKKSKESSKHQVGAIVERLHGVAANEDKTALQKVLWQLGRPRRAMRGEQLNKQVHTRRAK